MRRSRSHLPADVDAVDVLLVEDDDEDVAVDEVRTVLHELAVEAMARRATWAADLPHADPEADGTDSVPVPAPVSLARRLARRYQRRVVTGAVLAVAVATTTAVVDARQTAARAAALAAMPAVLAEASRPPGEVWRLPGRVVSDQHDALLVLDDGALRAVDPATGETLWTASAEAGRAASTGGCAPVDEGRRPDRAPVPDGTGPRDLVACVAHGPAGATEGDTAGGVSVVVLDSTTGRTRHTLTADGALLTAEPAGRDLVVAAALADHRVRIIRWELETGTPVWDAVSPVPVLTGTATADVVRRRPASLTIGSFAVDVTTGEQLDAELEGAKPYPYEEHALPNDARATWSWHGDGTSGQGRVAGGDAHSWYMLPGPPLRPRITDGSDRGVLVARTVAGDRLRGLDLRGGRMKWTAPFPDAPAFRATALVTGTMLLEGRATATAVDVRTGDRVWSTAVEPAVTDGLGLTDGEVVLLPVPADDGAVQLSAHRIADGTRVWAAELPPGTVSLTVVDHHLVAVTDDEVVGLG